MKFSDLSKKYQTKILSHFDSGVYPAGFLDEFVDLLARVEPDSLQGTDTYDECFEVARNSLVYTDDIWTMSRFYFTNPCDVTMEKLVDLITVDLVQVLSLLQED